MGCEGEARRRSGTAKAELVDVVSSCCVVLWLYIEEQVHKSRIEEEEEVEYEVKEEVKEEDKVFIPTKKSSLTSYTLTDRLTVQYVPPPMKHFWPPSLPRRRLHADIANPMSGCRLVCCLQKPHAPLARPSEPIRAGGASLA